MKNDMKTLLILLLAALCLVSCSERPANLTETVETEPETEPYVEPPKTYLEALRENLGYQDFPDSIHCYTEPLIHEEDFVDPSQITFGEEEERFISWNHMYELEIDAGEHGSFFDTNPNGNFLTDAKGKRVKLCPYDWCREDVNEACTHVDLSNGAVAGDWVYFVGQNSCVGAPNHPKKDSSGDINMLLRYSVTDHTIEKVLDLGGPSFIRMSHNGVIYLRTIHSTANIVYTILIDGENSIAAKISGDITPNTVGYEDSVYEWVLGCGLVRYTPALKTDKVIFEDTNPDIRANRKVIGSCKNGIVLLKRTENADGSVTDTITYITEKGKEGVLLKDHPQASWYIAGNNLYCVPHAPEDRHLFNAVFGTNTREYTVSTAGEVRAYSIYDTDSYTTVYTESMTTGEFLLYCQPYGNSIRISTLVPPTSPGTYPLRRQYLIKNGSLILDGEEEYRQY
ncbi:MAG: hypothetical protein IJF78_08905 [Clostridia bacterium]|nr:hypothetical protein [Clostridia bacterium]